MPRCEVLLNIGDTANQIDGGAISVAAPGVFVAPNDMNDFFVNNNFPDLSALRPAVRRKRRRALMHDRYFADPTIDVDAAAIARFGELNDIGRQQIQEMMTRAAFRREVHSLHGWDSTWGFGDLRGFAVAIADIPMVLMEDLTEWTVDLTVPPPAPARKLKRRGHRLPYERLLSAASVDQWRDADVHIPPARLETPFGATAWETYNGVIERTTTPASGLPGRTAGGGFLRDLGETVNPIAERNA